MTICITKEKSQNSLAGTLRRLTLGDYLYFLKKNVTYATAGILCPYSDLNKKCG